MTLFRPAARPAPILAALVAVAATAAASPEAAAAQAALPVVLEGRADVALDRRLVRLLESDALIVTRDTMFAAGDTIARSVLVLDASLIHEGTILGELVMVDAGAFVRPGSVITGDLVNIAGGLYRSELARVGGTIIDLPVAPYRVIREPTRIVIRADATPSRVVLDGFMGVQIPTYDRVNGLTLRWGATYLLPHLGPVVPTVHGQVGWQTQRGDPTYAVDLTLRAGANLLSLGHERAWDTNERWIAGDLANSLRYLWNGRDFRDYHEVDRSWIGLTRLFGDAGRRFDASATVRAQVEDATTLRAGEPWFILGSGTRPNPAVDDGHVTSVRAGAEARWRGLQTHFEGDVEYEAAREWLDGERSFDRVAARGSWAMQGFARHTLTIDYFLQAPLGDGVLPRQRWSFVGGPGTLHILDFARYYGDRVVFVESHYIIPMPERLALPVLGVPDLQLVHAAGMAWVAGEDAPLRQEVGVRLQFFSPYVRFVVDPADPSRQALTVGLAWPFGERYPWRR